MSVTSDNRATEEMTLGFELAAFERFENPAAVISDARTWSRYVGLIANDSDAVASYVREHDLSIDFDPGDRDKWLALEEIHEKTNTERHVFVGSTADGRVAAEQTGWEFLPVEEAAERASWLLADKTNKSSNIFTKFRNWI